MHMLFVDLSVWVTKAYLFFNFPLPLELCGVEVSSQHQSDLFGHISWQRWMDAKTEEKWKDEGVFSRGYTIWKVVNFQSCIQLAIRTYRHTLRPLPHHCSTIRSRTLLTFRSESRPKLLSKNGAAGGVRGCRPEVKDSSQSAGSKAGTSDLLFLDSELEGGVVQIGGGGRGAGVELRCRALLGEGGSSKRSEEHSGEDRKLSSFWRLVDCDWSGWGAGEEPERTVVADWMSVISEELSEK